MPYKGILPAKGRSVYLIQKLSAKVIIAVAGGAMKSGFSDVVLSECRKHFYAVILGDIVYSCKDILTFLFSFFCHFKKSFIDIKESVHSLYCP